MSKHKFTVAERFGLYRAYLQVCPWCLDYIPPAELTIDHIIPERLLTEDPSKLEAWKREFGLADEFSVNSFENWVPAHAGCNRRKGGTIPKPAPIMVHFLENAGRKAEKARQQASKIKRAFDAGPIEQMIEEAVDKGHLSADDLAELTHKALTLEVGDRLHLNDDWQVVSIDQNGTTATVIRGGHSGQTPLGDHDSSWICSRCGSPGPWNGVRCMTCGNCEPPD